jgi:hypothetical protein
MERAVFTLQSYLQKTLCFNDKIPSVPPDFPAMREPPLSLRLLFSFFFSRKSHQKSRSLAEKPWSEWEPAATKKDPRTYRKALDRGASRTPLLARLPCIDFSSDA